MLTLFTKISKFQHGNPQFLRHPIEFGIVDRSTAPDCKTELTIKTIGRIFVGARQYAFELQHDRKSISYWQRCISTLSLSRAFTWCTLKTADDYLMFSLSIKLLPCSWQLLRQCPRNCPKNLQKRQHIVQSPKGPQFSFLSRLYKLLTQQQT